jgi:hypothetical protein
MAGELETSAAMVSSAITRGGATEPTAVEDLAQGAKARLVRTSRTWSASKLPPRDRGRIATGSRGAAHPEPMRELFLPTLRPRDAGVNARGAARRQRERMHRTPFAT